MEGMKSWLRCKSDVLAYVCASVLLQCQKVAVCMRVSVVKTVDAGQ